MSWNGQLITNPGRANKNNLINKIIQRGEIAQLVSHPGGGMMQVSPMHESEWKILPALKVILH